ncbi:MAG: 5-formyltetrahydrofolate cyclo-ligase [Burkholderiales bacterium RIFCSPLOWO2_02_FULL_57_36]|nr:MAG: 5-formyltetrahydrofolate cyclo-ligase [Burkholderiales bacterium RIFCSPLOWO2_02_FULL_57_36]
MLNKTDLRRSLLAARGVIATDLRERCDMAIAERICMWLKENPVQSLGVYWPIKSEPDLRALYDDLSRKGIKLALPVVTGQDAPLAFAAWTPGDTLARDACGVPTPVERNLIRPEGLLIPCVGFNADNIRLGYGGGYYDRTLAEKPRPIAIGIAYSSARAAFNAGPHDVALDLVITD